MKTSMLVFEQGHLFKKTCQGEVNSVHSQQDFLDKGTCQGKLASVNEALFATREKAKYCYMTDNYKGVEGTLI